MAMKEVDFLDDEFLLQLTNEIEFSQFMDGDDIILSQIPMPLPDPMPDTHDFFSSGTFKLDFNLDDLKSEFPTTELPTTEVIHPSEKVEPENKPKSAEDSRWAKPLGDKEIEELLCSSKNKNTLKNTKWAFNVFTAWRESRGENVPLFLDMDAEQLSYWLSRFICEARKKNGNPYPSKSVYLIMCGLLRYLRDNDVFTFNFLDEKDPRFSKLNKVLDSKMKQLVEEGVDIETKSADPILPDDEDKLWNLGVFGNSSAEALQLTVFFYGCKFFGLRGYDEHRSLEHGQFTVGQDDRGKWIQFVGKSSKTNKGGLRSVRLDKKNIKHYCTEGPRCVADLFEEYLQAIGGSHFYRRPLAGLPIRYSAQPVGVQKIKTFMKTIAQKGGLAGNFTNHSGKKSCATALYDKNIDEQEIMQRTGHRSTEAVRKYKRATPQVTERTSRALNPPEPKLPKDKLSVPSEKDNSCESHATKCLSDITNSLPQGAVFSNCTFNF